MMGLELNRLTVGPLEVNCYIAFDDETKEGIIIDPGDEHNRIMEVLRSGGIKVSLIVCTHAHFDHVGAIPELKINTKAKIVIHEDDRQVYGVAKDMAKFWGFNLDALPAPDVFVKEGDELSVGSMKFKVLHTPGHSPGSMCLLGEGILFSGDTLFAGSIGRTDFPGGSLDQMKKSFKRLIALPRETKVFPGHGPTSTIEAERSENFFIHEL